MNLRRRLERLEDVLPAGSELSDDEQRRLSNYAQMDSNHTDYDELEHLTLYVKSRPGLTYEQLLEEMEALQL